MNKGINLLVPEKNDSILSRRIAILRMISLIFITLVVAASISLFFLILSSPLPSLRSQENATKQKLAEYQDLAQKYFVIRERLGQISSVVDQRGKYEVFMRDIASAVPVGAQIDELKIEDASVSIIVSSQSLLTLQSFIDTMQNLKIDNKKLSELQLSTLRIDPEDGKYFVELAMTLPI